MTRTLGVALAILAAGFLAAGCESGGIKSALPSVTASASINVPSPTVALPTVSPPTVSPPALPSRTRTPGQSAAPPSETGSAEPPTPTTEPSSPAALPPETQSPSPSAAPPAETTPAVAPAPAPSRSTESPAPSAEPSSPAAAEATPSPAASASGSSLLWLWILLGAAVIAVIAGLGVWLARRSGKRSALAASWRSKMAGASAKGLALTDMMTTAEVPGALAAADASARWADIQRRADDLAETLYQLRETAPGEAERAWAADVLASLQAVRAAMAAERAPGGAGAQQTARVHDLLLAFEASLRPRNEYGGPSDR
jgi:outer membrane biosynthesis protein TonB